MFFIDRLFMQQRHPQGGLPLVGQHSIARTDLETGEQLPPSVNQKIIEGSYSTKLTIRCDGEMVRVQGNPSRFHRRDNVFGLTSLDDCVAVFNAVLAQYNLPPFTPNTRLYHRQTPDNKASTLIGDGAEITSIDWTRNWAVGQGCEIPFIRGMSSMSLGRSGKTRQPKLYPNGQSCYWGEGSKWLLIKLYGKAYQLNEQLKKQRRRNPLETKELQYLEQLIHYLEINGVVREEHTLQQIMLKRHDLQFYGLVTEQDFLPHLNTVENAMNTIQISHDEHESIAQQLLNAGVVDTQRKANTTMNYFTLWQNGICLKDTLKQSQYYEHKARLKKIGIDISQQFDVTRMCPTLKRSQVIEVRPLEIPSWYQMPVTPNTPTPLFAA